MHLKMLSAEVICCTYFITLLVNISIGTSSVDPDQTAPVDPDQTAPTDQTAPAPTGAV